MQSPRSAHKPRKRRKADFATNGSSSTITIDAKSGHEKPAFPLVAFLWPARTSTSQWVILPCILMVAGLFRWCTAIWPYSGFQAPPMHGDYEAQRHWMELTVNLPVTHWYFHDLEWWGLDYPPLTAYHSWFLGQVGSLINPSWFALYLSRGLDDLDLKVFMRATVIVSEYLIYIPAVVICVRRLARQCHSNAWDSSVALTAILMQPATILIDHGHFQYNTVMLGFVAAALSNIFAGRALWTCVFFVAALGFKQMALFFAPAMGAYLAGSCLFPRLRISRFIGIALSTAIAFALLYLPILLGTWYDVRRRILLPSDTRQPPMLASHGRKISESAWYHPYILQITQSIHRIFPFARGLFEDKVANVWCALHSSGIHKLNMYSTTLLSRAALGLTLVSILPPCAIIFFKPKRELTLLAFATTAWGFFLCSYQVHEKNVLLPLLPMTLLLASEDGMKPANRAWIGFANQLALFTLFPLLVRDGLRIPYMVFGVIYAYLLGLPPFCWSLYSSAASQDSALHWSSKLLHSSTYVTIAIWHIVEAAMLPPPSKPDLFVVANVCLGAAGLAACYLWCLWRLVTESDVLRALRWNPSRVNAGTAQKKRQ